MSPGALPQTREALRATGETSPTTKSRLPATEERLPVFEESLPLSKRAHSGTKVRKDTTMARNLVVGNVLAEAAKIKQMWKENPSFSIPQPDPDSPALTAAEHTAMETTLATKEAEIEAARVHLAGLVENRDKLTTELSGWNVRIRRGVGFAFGLESAQYKQVGGTPPSERKPSTRKPKAPAP